MIIEKPTREQLERLLDAIRNVDLEPGEGIELLIPDGETKCD